MPLLRAINRRLLWRVRRKLTISYIFIGVVPATLIAAFFLLCGLILFFNVGGYIVRSRAASLVDEARFWAQLVAVNPGAALPDGAAKAIVAEDQVPAWIPRSGNDAALVRIGSADRPIIAARAVAWIEASARAVVVELPFEADVGSGAGAATPLPWV